MGVIGTFCQLCGLPVQHDHYVPSDRGYLNIYRGARPGGGHDWESESRKPFPLGPGQAWLADAVSVARFGRGVKRGAVEDGFLHAGPDDADPVMVWSGGDEDALAFHHWCWEAMGTPDTGDACVSAVGLLPYSFVARYHGQLFDLRALEADGKGWLAEDPRTSPRSRARIERLLELARRPPNVDDTTLSEIVKHDRDWVAVTGTDARRERLELIHYRAAPSPRTPGLEAFPHLLCLALVFDPTPRLPTPAELERFEAFTLAFGEALERDGLGVHVVSSFGAGRRQHLAYVKELTEAHRRVDALEGRGAIASDDYDDAHDPTWKIVFEEMGLPRR